MLDATYDISNQLAPWLLLGAAMAALLHGALPPGMIRKQFQGFMGVFVAVLFGVPLPLCSCGVIPAAIGLKKDGASDGAAIGFLISTPQTGVDSMFVSASFLGWPFAMFKVASAAVLGLTGGLLTEIGVRQSQPSAIDAPEPPSKRPSLAEAIGHGIQTIRSVWVWLVIGVLGSAALQTWVPNSVWTSLSAYGTTVTFGAVLGFSLPLYVCATASVPIAAALVAGGLPHGAALVFLMAGPATNLATTGAIGRQFGKRALGIYLLTIVGGSIAAGLLFDRLLQGQASNHHAGHHEEGMLATICSAVLALMIGFFALDDLRAAVRKRQRASSAPTHRVGVDGMTCQGCVRKLDKAVRAIPGLTSVRVELEPGHVEVAGLSDPQQLTEVIVQSGFRPRVDAKA